MKFLQELLQHSLNRTKLTFIYLLTQELNQMDQVK